MVAVVVGLERGIEIYVHIKTLKHDGCVEDLALIDVILATTTLEDMGRVWNKTAITPAATTITIRDGDDDDDGGVCVC